MALPARSWPGDMMKESAQKPGADVVLSDGSIARVTELSGEDSRLVEKFVSSLTDRTMAQMHGPLADRKELARRLVPGGTRRVLAALREKSIVGLAFYAHVNSSKAEADVVIADAFQGKGLGSILLGQLAQLANKEGIVLFEAPVAPDNAVMVNLLHELGFPTSTRIEPGVLRVEFPTSVDLTTVEAFEKRESFSVVAAVRNFLEPRTIAVVGASKDRDSIGGRLFHNLIEGGSTVRSTPSTRSRK